MPMTIFIGREQEQQCYQEFLHEDSPWIIVLMGLGGSGKSMLLHHMEKQTPPGIVVIKHNFAAEALRFEGEGSTRKALSLDPLSVIESFASQIRYSCNAQQYNSFKETLAQCRRQLVELRTQIVQSIRVCRRDIPTH